MPRSIMPAVAGLFFVYVDTLLCCVPDMFAVWWLCPWSQQWAVDGRNCPT